MKIERMKLLYSLLTVAGMLATIFPAHTEEAAAPAAVSVSMTVTANVAGNKRMPDINQNDVLVKLGKESPHITNWVAARGDRAGLDLFILIDDSLDARIGLQFDDLREFINAQPPTTSIGIGYMRNATVQVVQDFTTNHALAANALRLPTGLPGAYGSPYLSVIDLMKHWPQGDNRREVVMVTDGIDHARRHLGWHRGFTTNPDAETASAVAQKTGKMIHAIYAPGASRFHRNYWIAMNGQMSIARLSDTTGGESFYLGLHSPVSFKPYLDSLQQTLDNQYLLSFSAKPGKKAGLQHVTLRTEVAGVEFSAHDAVWVPAGE